MTPVRKSHGRASEGLAMSLSAWEQQTLDSIGDDLAGSDPQLAALLTTFTRLASAEEMPVRETIVSGRSRRIAVHLKLQWVMLLLWLLITVAMVTVALTLTHGGGPGTCTGSWSTLCSHSAAG
jgi:Protein of unknown function (DUF3040)